ncbi:MAG: E3 ubiquitin ligase family protein [Myxococcota bacterium]
MDPLLIAGLVCVGGAGLLLFFSKRATHRATLMATTETRKLGDISALVDEVRAEIGEGSESGYAEHCELKGKLVAPKPVTGELSGEEVAIYEMEVIRVIETRRERRDDEGHVSVTWSKSNETLSSNRREAVFHLDDGTGRVRVIPSGSEMQLDTIVDRFEAPSAVEHMGGSQLALRVGNFNLAVSGGHHGNQRRTLGYRFEERVLPLDRSVYVLGEVADTADGLVLRKPTTTEGPYVVALKSEAELIQLKESSAKWLKIGAITSVITGIALVVMGLLK